MDWLYDKISSVASRYLIWYLEKMYICCKIEDFEEDCVSCDALKTSEFLKGHLNLLK